MSISLTFSFGKGPNRPNSDNFTNGLKCIEQQDYENAYTYFVNEYSANPKSGYALYWIGYIRMLYSEYGRSLEAYTKAISLLPPKDTPYLQSAYAGRSSVYLNLGDTARALADLNTGIKVDPSNVAMYSDRAEIYFAQKKYAQADDEYKKMIKLNPGSLTAYMGLGRNLKEKGKYEEAIKQFNYVISLDENYSDAYAFRADAYNQMKKYDEATSDIISTFLLKDDQIKAVRLMIRLDNEAKQMLVSKMKAEMVKSPDKVVWPFYIGEVIESTFDYKGAIPYYDKALSLDFSPSFSRRLSYCYRSLAAYDEAMKYNDLTIRLDSSKYDELVSKAFLYAGKGDLKSAISTMDEYVKKRPDRSYSYRERAMVKMYNKQYEDALEDLDLAVTLAPKSMRCYYCRARIYDMLGKKDKAEADYKKVLELDPERNRSSETYYTLALLGKKDEAEKVMSDFYKDDQDLEEKSNVYYNKACFYSLVGKTDEAIENLKKSLENGWRDFSHIGYDPDLENIRELPKFKELIKEYKAKLQEELKEVKKIKSNVNIEEQLKLKEVEKKENEL
ncbi:MAG: tetratricopeptide repeat protein [Paludibacteraceae bacterium]|nr:tetratricopeptide repeat protein [Paludibacteraceae bacterium]